MPSPLQQDHIVLLVDTPTFEHLPTSVTQNFTVIQGGYHEGQASRNKLVLFKDGTYLEFFNWYDTPPAMDDPGTAHLPMRVWARKEAGLIDFALTDVGSSAAQTIVGINSRLGQAASDSTHTATATAKESETGDAGLGVTYGNPIPGSRKRGDGTQIKWEVTRPVFSSGPKTPGEELFVNGRIDTPFFCHDLTPRTLRVPSEDRQKTTHPCGAIGIAACSILVPEERFAEYVTLYANLLGVQPAVGGTDGKKEEGGMQEAVFEIGVPLGEGVSRIVVKVARTAEERRRLRERGVGLVDLVIMTEGEGGEGKKKERRRLGDEEWEATIWLE